MALICPTCSRRAEITARYCRDCYTVFPSNARSSAKPQQAETSAIWKYLPLVLLAAGGAWFIPLENTPPTTAAVNDPWSQAPAVAEPQSSSSAKVESSASTRQTATATSASSDGSGTAGGRSIGSDGCTSGPGPNACPDLFSKAPLGTAEQRKARSSPSAEAGETAALVLPSKADLPCPPGETCPVVVRFSSGESATYIARGGGSSRTLVPADDRAAALLKKHGQATAEIRTRSGSVRAVSVRKTSVSGSPR